MPASWRPTASGILQIDDNVTNTGTLKATGGGELDVKGTTITDSSTTAPVSTGTEQIDTGSELLVDNTHLTLNGDGSGKVTLAGTALITGAASGNELENSNNSITGAGTISNLTLVNDTAGIIDATGTLVLNTGNTISNAGLLEATAGGTLQIGDNVTNTGTLKATGGGELDIKSATITDNLGGTEQIDTGSELLVDNTHLTLNGDGSGKVTLAGTALITGAAKTNELENVNKTISGAGTISNLMLVNDAAGIIDATGTLVLNTGTTISNAGLLEATASGILQIDDNVTNTGTLKATGGGELDIKSATITDNLGGTEEIDTGSELLVDNTHLTLNGDGSGKVTLAGTALITGAAKTNELENVNKTISGAGTISNLMLVNDTAGIIDASVATKTLTIQTGNTISNSGLWRRRMAALSISKTTSPTALAAK